MTILSDDSRDEILDAWVTDNKGHTLSGINVMLVNNTQMIKEIKKRMTEMEAAIVVILQELNK